jgi:hypothetical protein
MGRHVEIMGESREIHTEILCTNLRKRDNLKYLGVRGMGGVILKWMLNK